MKCRRKLKGEIQPMRFCYFVRLRQMKWEVKTELSRHLKAFKTSLHVRAVCWVVKLLHWCWQGWDAVLYVCSSSSSSPGIQGLHLSLFLTLPLSLSHARTHTCSLSLSSVTLVTYFLHGNSISCCAHRKKERRKKNATWSDWNVCVCVCVTVDLSWEIWPTVQMRLSYYCSACLTTKLTVWLSSGPVKHNSRWQAFIIRM